MIFVVVKTDENNKGVLPQHAWKKCNPFFHGEKIGEVLGGSFIFKPTID